MRCQGSIRANDAYVCYCVGVSIGRHLSVCLPLPLYLYSSISISICVPEYAYFNSQRSIWLLLCLQLAALLICLHCQTQLHIWSVAKEGAGERVKRSVKQTFLHALLDYCLFSSWCCFFFVSQSFGRITIFFIFVVLFPMGPAVGVDIHKYSSHCFALLFLWLLFLRLSSLLTTSPALPSLLLPQVSAIYVDYFYGAVTWWPIENQNRIHLNTTSNMSICMQRNRKRERERGRERKNEASLLYSPLNMTNCHAHRIRAHCQWKRQFMPLPNVVHDINDGRRQRLQSGI